MAFEIDIGFTSLAGGKDINEDFCAAMLPEAIPLPPPTTPSEMFGSPGIS